MYHLFNKFEILLIAIPKFDKVPNLAKVLPEMLKSEIL